MASASTLDKENLGVTLDGPLKKSGLRHNTNASVIKKTISSDAKPGFKPLKSTRKALGDVKNVSRGQELLEGLAKVHSQNLSTEAEKPKSSKRLGLAKRPVFPKSAAYEDVENMPAGPNGNSYKELSEQILPLKDRLSERSPTFFRSLLLPPKKVTRDELLAVYPEVEAEMSSPFPLLPSLTDEDFDFIRNFDQLDLDECLL